MPMQTKEAPYFKVREDGVLTVRGAMACQMLADLLQSPVDLDMGSTGSTFFPSKKVGYVLDDKEYGADLQGFENYRKKGITEMRPYKPGEVLESSVSISLEDRVSGSPRVGDMIARNPANPQDQWLVAKAYFEKNYKKL